MELTKKSAKKYAIAKWKLIVKYGGNDLDILFDNDDFNLTEKENDLILLLDYFESSCSYCEFYINNCEACSLNIIAGNTSKIKNNVGCIDEYKKWYRASEKGNKKLMVKYAKEILELIKKS